MSFTFRLWRATSGAAVPLLERHLARRAARGKEIAARLPERRGEGAARPDGRLFWVHAASVGETLSALPLLQAMADLAPDLHFLFTTGTVTSAETLRRRLPAGLAPRVSHRFVPLDVPHWVSRFLDGWRPDAGAFIESELWPNLLAEAARRGIPLALVNARMGPRSFALWRRAPGLARQALGAFRLVLAREEGDRSRFAALGAPGLSCWGDLKLAAPPLPVDHAALARLQVLMMGRPVFLAASTHPGEEALAIEAHRRLAPRFPGLLTVLVPRHPERGAEIEAQAAGLPVARRRAGGTPQRDVEIYVADTLGELGLFYRLASVALIGGSLVRRGGQNPLEPARLGCPIVVGPHTFNFAELVARLVAVGGAVQLRSGDVAALAEVVADVLSDPRRGQAMAKAAASVAESGVGLPGRIAAALLDLLPAWGGSPARTGEGLGTVEA